MQHDDVTAVRWLELPPQKAEHPSHSTHSSRYTPKRKEDVVTEILTSQVTLNITESISRGSGEIQWARPITENPEPPPSDSHGYTEPDHGKHRTITGKGPRESWTELGTSWVSSIQVLKRQRAGYRDLRL